MNCKQAEELLPLYAGRDLEEKRATLVTEHLQTCVTCARVADEYRESVQMTEQFAPPVFSEAVYAGIRQRVLREIETEAMAPAWSQTVASFFGPRVTWAIASVLLIVVSVFAIYFMMNKGVDEQRWAIKPPAKAQPGTIEDSNSGSQRNGSPSVSGGGKKQQLAGVSQPQRKRSRDTLADRLNTVPSQSSSLPEAMLFPHRDSAALVKTLRLEIQTNDPKIRIIWFVQQETKPVNSSSKGI